MDPREDRSQLNARNNPAAHASRHDELQQLVVELEQTLAATAAPATWNGRAARADIEAHLQQAKKRLREPGAFLVDLAEPLCTVEGCLGAASLDSMSLDETWLCEAHRADLARTVLQERIAPDAWLVKALAAQVVALRREAKAVPQAELAEQALELAARMTTREDASRWDEARAIAEVRRYPGLVLPAAATDDVVSAAIEAFRDGSRTRLHARAEDELRALVGAPRVPRAPARGRRKGSRNRKGTAEAATPGTVAARNGAVASVLGLAHKSVTRAKQKSRRR
jgi:hypothetical protein